MKFGTLWAKCWGLALAAFGRDPRCSDSLRGSQNFVFFPVMRITHDVSDLLSAKFYDISTQQRRSVSQTFGTKFWKFYHTGSLFQRTQKLFTKFPGRTTSGRQNSAMITNAEHSRLNSPPAGCLVSIIKVRINSKSFSGTVRCAPGTYFPPPNCFTIFVTASGINR